MTEPLYDVWEQEEPHSDYYIPICKAVNIQFAQWSIKPENCPEGLDRYYQSHDPALWKRIEKQKAGDDD